MMSGYENYSQSAMTVNQGGEYNRKEKSLGELCRRFLSIYGKQSKDFLLLDQCTKELGVERRRIYDIINILESFCVIRRLAKNSY
jgi:transcription factor E2F7/8